MGAGVVVGANVVVSFAANAEVVLFAASACATHRSRMMNLCRGAILARQCWSGCHAVNQGCFASRARHAAAALLPPIASIYIGAWGSVYAAMGLGSALRSAPQKRVRG